MASFDQLATELTEVNTRLAELKERKADLESSIVKLLGTSTSKRHAVGDSTYSFATVARESVVVNDAELLAELTQEQREMVTKRVYDSKLLERAIDDGSIDPELLVKHSSVKQHKPYVRVTQL